MIPEIRTMHHAHLSQMRCLTVEPSTERPNNGRPKDVYCIYEFPSTLAIRRGLAERQNHAQRSDGNGNAGGTASRSRYPVYVVHSTVIDHPDVWTQKIETCLPFVKIQSTIVAGSRDGWQLNEDCVIIRSSHPKCVFPVFAPSRNVLTSLRCTRRDICRILSF